MVLDFCVWVGDLSKGLTYKGDLLQRKENQDGVDSRRECKVVRGSQRRHLHKEPILIEMTRQHVWDNGAAETDSRGKKEIKEVF